MKKGNAPTYLKKLYNEGGKPHKIWEYIISIICICWGMFYGHKCGLYWWMFHMILRKMCVLLSLDKVVYRYPLYPADCQCWVQLHGRGKGREDERERRGKEGEGTEKMSPLDRGLDCQVEDSVSKFRPWHFFGRVE